MIVGSISENKGIEKRIAITPGIAKKYISNGFEVFIEKGLGEHLGISDSEFVKEGCKVETKETIISKSNIFLQLNLPEEKNLNQLNENAILIGNFNTSNNHEEIQKISKKKYLFFHYSYYQESQEHNPWIFFHPKQILQATKQLLTHLQFLKKPYQ